MGSGVRSNQLEVAMPLVIALVAATSAVVLGSAIGGDAVEQAQLVARWTARAAFLIFLPVYSASALVRLFPAPATRMFVRRRRQWGLAFALAHTVHLGALINYLAVSGDTRPMAVFISSGLVYALVFAMALTSNDASQRLLGRWWKRLHTLGIHYIWFYFLLSYASRLADPERMHIGLAFTPLVLGALALRLATRFRSARRRRELGATG